MKMGNIARGRFDVSKVQFISPGVMPDSAHLLRYGDVLFNTRNTLDLVGKVAVWREELPVAYYNSNLMRLEFDPQIVCSTEYANYALNTDGSIARLRALATGTTSVAAIYTRDFYGFLLAVPTLAEQQAIATALSDADALIESLEQLLAKKRQIKQGAMQELLTAKRRLPGFEGEWVVKRLGDVASLKNGYAFQSKTYSDLGAFKIVTIANVQDGFMSTEGANKIASLPKDIQAHQILSIGDILVSMTGNVGRVCRVDDGGCLLNQRVGKLVPHEIDLDYFYFLVKEPRFLAIMQEKAVGGAQGNISKSDITDFSLHIPRAEEEQAAIATILSDMDADIATLEAKLAKARAIKQGMMQELLTGRIRLI
jgi:type I restriction enzyme S subunit